jgi:precorrin-6A synthase
MRTLLLIGIGTGHPEHLTLEAVQALQRVDVFFALDKGEEKEDLVRWRSEICARHLPNRPYRFVTAPDPVRDPSVACYPERVRAWHDARAVLYEEMLLRELGESGCGGILVWGDPCLYDSTLRVLASVRVRARVTFDMRVIPGISSVQALAASHGIVLNGIGEPVLITTGRKLAAGFPRDVDSVVVMLDGACIFNQLDEDLDIFWGAYLGSPEQLLRAGRVREVGAEIAQVRAEARKRRGWVLDIYLLRRRA